MRGIFYRYPWRWAILGAGALLAGCASTAAARPVPEVDKDPASCARCHPAETREWAESRHAVAYVNRIFQSEFTQSRPAWCVSCHAPAVEKPESVQDSDPMAQQGVGCISCHLREGRMVSASASPSSPHQTKVDPSFGSAEFCASCHEFNFPILDKEGRLLRYTDEPMQETFRQFQESALGRKFTCNDCHARTPGKHLFPGSHDVAMLLNALTLKTCREQDSLKVGVQNHGAAHHVPSGGVHRYMVVRVWRPNAPEKRFEGYIGRKFRPLASGGKEKILDTTIPEGETRWFQVNVDALGHAADPHINIELRYVYGLDEYADLEDTILSQVILHERVELQGLSDCP